MTSFIPAPRLLTLFVALLATITSGIAEPATATKDGVIIAADASVGPTGRTHITCSLTNQSPFMLASIDTHSACPCFQFKLLDASGTRVSQDERWSKSHRQEEWNDPNDHRSLNEIWVAPSKREEFQFDLEDAYGDRAAQGRSLEVKWRNVYSGQEATLSIRERINSDGQVEPAHEEVNHFPGLWTVAVSVPLPKRGDDEKAAPDSAGPPANPPPEKASQDIPINKTPPLAANTPKNSPASSNPWWWALLAIPALLLVWFGLRTRKQT